MSSMARWPPAFGGAAAGRLGVPARGQLLDGGHVDRAVVQVLLDLGEVGGEEPAVRADRVPGQGHRPGLRDVGPDELERLATGVLEGELRRPDLLEQAAGGVHVPDEVVHGAQLLLGGVHDQVGALGHHRQLVVGHQGGDLHDDVTVGLESRHLQVHPHQHAVNLPEGWPPAKVTVRQNPGVGVARGTDRTAGGIGRSGGRGTGRWRAAVGRSRTGDGRTPWRAVASG